MRANDLRLPFIFTDPVGRLDEDQLFGKEIDLLPSDERCALKAFVDGDPITPHQVALCQRGKVHLREVEQNRREALRLAS